MHFSTYHNQDNYGTLNNECTHIADDNFGESVCRWLRRPATEEDCEATIPRYVFGIGIFGMGLSAATMLIIINSLCFCERLNRPAKAWAQFIGGSIWGISGKVGWNNTIVIIVVFSVLVAMGHVYRVKKQKNA